MKRALFALLAIALIATPHAGASAPKAAYPAGIVDLAGEWIAQAESLGAPYADREWYPRAERFLDEAKDAQAEGRVRVVLYDLETYTELVLANAIMDDAAALSSESDRKSLAIERSRDWVDDADATWRTFRHDLSAHDGNLRSLQSVERALFAADMAVLARLGLSHHEHFARELPKEPRLDEGYALALVRASHTNLLNLQWASDILGTLGSLEGLPPRLNETSWKTITNAALLPLTKDETPPTLHAFLPLRAEARENDEGLLATAIMLAELRASRASSIMVIFGDGSSRGLNSAGDATKNMGKRLANTTMASPESYGLEGLFTADAIDRASYTLEFADKAEVDLGIVVGAWAGLDHADFVIAALGPSSPIQPAVEDVGQTPKKTPAPAALLVVLALVGAAASRRRA